MYDERTWRRLIESNYLRRFKISREKIHQTYLLLFKFLAINFFLVEILKVELLISSAKFCLDIRI